MTLYRINLGQRRLEQCFLHNLECDLLSLQGPCFQEHYHQNSTQNLPCIGGHQLGRLDVLITAEKATSCQFVMTKAKGRARKLGKVGTQEATKNLTFPTMRSTEEDL